jgi:hypothetical protein
MKSASHAPAIAASYSRRLVGITVRLPGWLIETSWLVAVTATLPVPLIPVAVSVTVIKRSGQGLSSLILSLKATLPLPA